VHLRWSTATETNNAGFELQLRDTGSAPQGWQPVDFIEGHGTTGEPHSYAYTVTGLPPGAHRFRLKQIDADGAFHYSPEVEIQLDLPGGFLISPPYPNPFTLRTELAYRLAASGPVRLAVYDALGRTVAVLVDRHQAPGHHRVVFEAGSLPSGLYVYRLEAGARSESRTMLLVK
jgi:hypothetical protein